MERNDCMTLTSKQKAYLKSEAHHLQPIFQIGKSGLSGEGLRQIEEALEKRELIKIHLLQNTAVTLDEAARMIEKEIHAELVQKIGKTLVLYKPSTKVENKRLSIELPR